MSKHEFFQASGIYRDARGSDLDSRSHVNRLDEFQLDIPWRVALQQSPPPLNQPGRIMRQECGDR